ncbi:hypothetical protein L1049_002012 [Liquidambar formosana]|uniref:Uncharacterized protein n=1 Tax=Liquidambar formosana TaxID=63359 RepID=A0AAP0R7Y2_LIQFO
MWSPTYRCSPRTLLMMLLVFISVSIPINAALSKKVDQIVVPQPPDAGIKCTACSSCENPCAQQFTPPPPPPPPPPPKIPPPENCNCINPLPLPPPPPRFVYVTGPPGNMYPMEPYDLDFYSGAGRSVPVGLLILVVCGVLQLLVCL